jgi:hypothetical protein
MIGAKANTGAKGPATLLAAGLFLAGYFAFSPASGGYEANLAALLCLGALAAVFRTLAAQGRLKRCGPGAGSPWINLLIQGAALAALAVLLASLCLEAIRLVMVDWREALWSPFTRTFIEGRELTKAWLLAHGRTIYPDFTDYPFIATLYGPVYHGLTALALTFVEAAGTPLRAGLMVSMAGAVGLTLAFFGVVRLLSGRLFLAALFALALFTAPYLEYAHHTRPDMAAWCFSFAGLFFFLLAERGKGTASPWLYLAAGFAALAYFTKQQSLPFPLAMCAYSFFARKRRLCFAYAISAAVLALGFLTFMQFAGDGDFMLHTFRYPGLIASDPDITKASFLFERFARLFTDYPTLILLYLLALADNIRRRALTLPDVLFFAHFPFLYVLMSTWGAEINYFISFLATMYLGAAVFLGRIMDRRPEGVLITAILLALFIPARFDASFLTKPPKDFAAEKTEAAAIRQAVGEAPGEVIIDAEGAHLFLSDPALAAKLKIYDGTETFSFVKVGLWEPVDTSFGLDIKARRPSYFIDSQVFISPKILSLLSYFYEKDKTIGKYTFYRPRPEDAIATFSGGGEKVASSISGATGDGITVSLVSAEDLQDWGNYLQAKEGAISGSLTLKVEGSRPMESLAVVFFPRLQADGGAVRALWSRDGAVFQEFARFDVQKGSPGEGWDNRLDAALPDGGKELFIRFELAGGAQLWFNKEHPLGFFAEFKRS